MITKRIGMILLLGLLAVGLAAQSTPSHPVNAAMDRDLMEVTIPKLEGMYAAKKYTATQVTQWYLDRIDRYNGVYKAVMYVNRTNALAAAAAEDAESKKGGKRFKRSALWGVPIVTKENTSVKGLLTSDGWKGFMIPGHELIAPQNAPIVARLKAAGAIIVGQTNMPDFAASDTNLSSAFGRTGNAYDWRFSPGGSSGGTVTAITSNLALFGTGTDTANSIRMPSATSSVVGLLPTRGLVSIAGIAPLDWLMDNTGPIARDVTDVAIALGVMAGEDPRDFRTLGSAAKAQPGPYTQYLKADALKGKRFGVPAFMLAAAPAAAAGGRNNSLRPETREMFMKAIEGLKAAGATVVFDDDLLPSSFTALTSAVNSRPYHLEGTESFLRDFGPADYHSAADYARAVGSPLPGSLLGGGGRGGRGATPAPVTPAVAPAPIQQDPNADANFWAPQRKAIAAYEEAFDKFHLDGLVYPAINMPPNDETIPQPDGRPSSGPHSNTGWVNRIGVPAISVPGGFYASGLPFGMEISARPWKDGDLLGYAFAYEQATKHRKPPVLVDKVKDGASQ